MNIAIMIPSLDGGGAEKVASVVGNYWSDNGHNVYFFLIEKEREIVNKVKGEIIYIGIPQFCSADKLSSQLYLYYIARNAKKLKREYCIDVTVSFLEWCNAINIFSKAGDRVVLGIRSVMSKLVGATDFYYSNQFIHKTYNRADNIVSVSEFSRQDMIKNYGIKEKKMVTIPNISNKKASYDQEIEWEYGDHAVICLSRLVIVKQLDRAIRAFSETVKKVPDAKLLIMGDGPLRDYLEMICRKMDLSENVFFLGYISSPEEYLKNARAFVMASRYEGFPNSMVEAMACGVPVITTDSPGGCGEIVGKKHKCSDIQYCEYGILTPHMCGKAPRAKELDPEETMLGNAITQILDNDSLYQKYREASLKRAGYYSKDRIMKMWDEAIMR